MPDDTESRRPGRAGMLLFASLLLLYCCSYFQRTAIPGQIFDRLLGEGLTALQIANIGAAFVYMYSPMQLAIGVVIDRYGGVRTVACGGVLFVLGSLLFPFQTTVAGMIAARMLTGLGAGTFYLSLVRESDRLFGRRNYAVIMGLVYLLGYGGGLLGTWPFEHLAGIFPYRTVLLAVGLLSAGAFLAFLPAAFGAASGRSAAPASGCGLLSGLRQAAGNPRVWAVSCAASVTFGTYFTLQTLIGRKMLEDLPGLSPRAASAAVFSLTLTCMAVLFFSSLASRLLGNRRRGLLRFAVLLNLASTLLLFLAIAGALPGWVFVAALIGVAAASGFVNLFQIAAQELNSPGVMTQTSGLVNMLNYFTVVLFSLGVGAVLDCSTSSEALHYPPSAYLTLAGALALLAVIGAVCGFLIPETCGRFARTDVPAPVDKTAAAGYITANRI